MARRPEYHAMPPAVLARMLAVLLICTIVGVYFVGQTMGLISPIYGENTDSPEQRRALAKHNAAVKHLIATRNARAAAVRAADRAGQAAQAQRDAPPKPVVPTEPVAEAEPVAE